MFGFECVFLLPRRLKKTNTKTVPVTGSGSVEKIERLDIHQDCSISLKCSLKEDDQLICKKKTLYGRIVTF